MIKAEFNIKKGPKGSIKYPLANGKFALLDEQDFPLIQGISWRIDRCGYAISNNRVPCVLMHRVIMGAKPSEIVDHINHVPHDNRRENLRIVSPAESSYNRRPMANKRFKGVFEDQYGMYRVQIQRKGKLYYVGYFAHEDVAAVAYDIFANRLFGKFAYFNFNPSSRRAKRITRSLLADRLFAYRLDFALTDAGLNDHVLAAA